MHWGSISTLSLREALQSQAAESIKIIMKENKNNMIENLLSFVTLGTTNMNEIQSL